MAQETLVRKCRNFEKTQNISMFYEFGGIRSKVWRDFLKVCLSTKTTQFEAQLEQRLELFYLEHII